mgnify:FL=1
MLKQLLRCATLALLTAATAGCSSLSPKGIDVNPVAIHKASPSQVVSTATGTVTSAVQAELVPVQAYYTALTAARSATGSATTTAIRDYVDAGITLVNSYCLRWFQSLSERDVVKSFEDGNFNVIRQLGTALLGLGKANTYFVTTYGATNTAYEGISKNFSDAFLIAPNSRKVKAQVMSLLDAREKELLETAKAPRTFAEACRRLERFADLCTHSTAKEIVNNALDQSKATAEDDGRITLSPTSDAINRATTQAVATANVAKAAAEASVQPLKESVKTLETALTRQTDASAAAATTTQQLATQLNALRQELLQEKARAEDERSQRESLQRELQQLKAAKPAAPENKP